jgi:hypothetical protein
MWLAGIKTVIVLVFSRQKTKELPKFNGSLSGFEF